VQAKGTEAQAQLEVQLQAQASGGDCEAEAIDPALLTLPLAIAADGVMVPFRLQRQTPKGKTKWHEIKIPVLDFFHATGQLWRATTALFDDPRSAQAMAWFTRWRHHLRHGKHQLVLTTLTQLINTDAVTGKSLTTLL